MTHYDFIVTQMVFINFSVVQLTVATQLVANKNRRHLTQYFGTRDLQYEKNTSLFRYHGVIF